MGAMLIPPSPEMQRHKTNLIELEQLEFTLRYSISNLGLFSEWLALMQPSAPLTYNTTECYEPSYDLQGVHKSSVIAQRDSSDCGGFTFLKYNGHMGVFGAGRGRSEYECGQRLP